MRQLAGNRHVVQLYGLIGMNSDASEQLVNGKKLIMPGMVMEYLPGKSMNAYFDEFKSGGKTVDEVAQELTCMIEQTAIAVDAMIKQGFTHTDLNPGNIVRSGQQYISATTGVKCPLIKVIDFGYTEDVKANHLEQVKAVSRFAYQMDKLIDEYTKQAPDNKDRLQPIIRPSLTTVNIFEKFFRT